MKPVILDGKTITPSKIVCVGRNYSEHIQELDNDFPEEPVIFIKPNSSICEQIHSGKNNEIQYEGEITFIVKSGVISGVGFGIDLTKREIQANLKAKGLPWERAKCFDKSAVFSHFVTFSGNINGLKMELYINDERVQEGGCNMMLNKPEQLLTDIKTFLSLEDGDLIMSGTPQGVGTVTAGDRYTGKIFDTNKLIVEASWQVQ